MNLLVEMSAGEARSVFFSLGVDTSDLSADELKKKYRQLMMKNHPDRGGDAEVAKRLSVAYDALKDTVDGAAPKSRPADQARPSRQKSFEHIDYVKEWFAEQTAGKASQQWSVMNFDGRFFRNSFTVPGNHDLFSDMARIMKFGIVLTIVAPSWWALAPCWRKVALL